MPSVCDIDFIEAMSSLVDKNLVRMTPDAAGRPRFSMLQTIREYASEQLAADSASAAATRSAHAAHYTAVALDLHRQLTYADRAGVLAALGDELGNLRAAWDHWVQQSDVGRLDELLEPLWGYYEARGDYRAVVVLGDDFLQVLSALPETPERKHDELTLRTNLARTQLAVRGFTPEAERAMGEALRAFRRDRRGPPPLPRAAEPGDTATHAIGDRAGDGRGARADGNRRAGVGPRAAVRGAPARPASAATGWTTCRSPSIMPTRPSPTSKRRPPGFVEFRVGPNPGVVANVGLGTAPVDGGPRRQRRHPRGRRGSGSPATSTTRIRLHTPSITQRLLAPLAVGLRLGRGSG